MHIINEQNIATIGITWLSFLLKISSSAVVNYLLLCLLVFLISLSKFIIINHVNF